MRFEQSQGLDTAPFENLTFTKNVVNIVKMKTKHQHSFEVACFIVTITNRQLFRGDSYFGIV